MPVPYVSAAAVAKVRDRVPVPDVCPHCGGTVALVNNSVIYGGQAYGRWPWAYLCSGCNAYVGTHPETDLPLGTLATKPIREARKRAKEQFNSFWQGKMSRSKAYSRLAGAMGIPPEKCHFAWFDIAQCEAAVVALTALRAA